MLTHNRRYDAEASSKPIHRRQYPVFYEFLRNLLRTFLSRFLSVSNTCPSILVKHFLVCLILKQWGYDWLTECPKSRFNWVNKCSFGIQKIIWLPTEKFFLNNSSKWNTGEWIQIVVYWSRNKKYYFLQVTKTWPESPRPGFPIQNNIV